MKTPQEFRAELYEHTREELENAYAVAEEGRRRAAIELQMAEEGVERAGNRWLAIHGRLYPLTEGEFADLEAHPIPVESVVATNQNEGPQ